MKTQTDYKKLIPTEADMLAFGASLAQVIPAGAVIYLHGSLGAGKTTLTRGMLRGLGYLDKVKSPTYTLVEPYEVAGRSLFHFDLYRLHHANELEHIGIHEYFTENSICIIEWPDKGAPVLPAADLDCFLDFQDQARQLRLHALTTKGEDIIRLCSL